MFLQTVFISSPRQILEETMQDHVLATRRGTVLRSVPLLVVSDRIFRLLPPDIIETRNKETWPLRGNSSVTCYYAFQWDEQILCDFDRASSLICGNKMPTRCNRGFCCRSYCLLNMFRAPLCPSSGAQEYYTVVAACGISCCGFQVAGLVWS